MARRTAVPGRRARRAGLVAGVLAALTLAGCAQGGGTGGMTGGSGGGPDNAGATPVLIGVVTKTDGNPYFIRIQDAATAAAAQWRGARVQAMAGRYDGDNDGQVAAVKQLLAAGAKGLLVVPSNSTGIVDVLNQAKARGVLVVVLDTETDPASVPDTTFATVNTVAGGTPPRRRWPSCSPSTRTSTRCTRSTSRWPRARTTHWSPPVPPAGSS
jgi:fructose transport system substrate-binding protein